MQLGALLTYIQLYSLVTIGEIFRSLFKLFLEFYLDIPDLISSKYLNYQIIMINKTYISKVAF